MAHLVLMLGFKMVLAFGFSGLLACSIAGRVRADAGSHFDAGVRAFEEQRFADAAVEFERAYAARPAWQVLYNLGTVYAALGRPVDAVDAFERYLAQAGDSVGSARRQDVQLELDKQRARVGWLQVRVNASGADIRIDARSVGTSPLTAAVALAAGPHTLEVELETRKPDRRQLTIEAGRSLSVDVTLSAWSTAPDPTPPAVAYPGQAQRIVGFCLGGAGLIGAAVGGGIVASGQIKHLDAVDLAKRGERAEAEAFESTAEHRKTLGFATLGVSGAVFLAGAIVLLSAPDGAKAASGFRVSGWASSSSGGVLVNRSW